MEGVCAACLQLPLLQESMSQSLQHSQADRLVLAWQGLRCQVGDSVQTYVTSVLYRPSAEAATWELECCKRMTCLASWNLHGCPRPNQAAGLRKFNNQLQPPGA